MSFLVLLFLSRLGQMGATEISDSMHYTGYILKTNTESHMQYNQNPLQYLQVYHRRSPPYPSMELVLSRIGLTPRPRPLSLPLRLNPPLSLQRALRNRHIPLPPAQLIHPMILLVQEVYHPILRLLIQRQHLKTAYPQTRQYSTFIPLLRFLALQYMCLAMPQT